jgi:hypothetical protein
MVLKLENLGIPVPRTKPVEQWLEGKPDLLIDQVIAGDLNEAERELVASIIRGDAPKRERGAKLSTLKPVAAKTRY